MKTFLRLVGLTRPYAWWMLLAALIGFATIGSGIGLLMASAWIISRGALLLPAAALQAGISGVRIFGAARGVLRYAERLVSHNTTFRILTRIRMWFYDAIEPLAPARLAAYRSADLLKRIVDDIQNLENIYARVIAPPLTAVMVTILIWVLVARWSVGAAAGVLACQVMAGAVVPFAAARVAKGTASRIAGLQTEEQLLAVDLVQGMGELTVFGMLDEHLGRLHAAEAAKLELERRAATIEGVQETLCGLCMNAGVVWVIWQMLPLVRTGNVGAVSMAAILFGVIASFEAFLPLTGAAQHIEADVRAGQRLFDIIDTRAEVTAPSRPLPFPVAGDLEADDLKFTYPGSSRPALDGISFRLRRGGRFAIVGPSGSGKSTIASLLVRFWNPTGGKLSLDGTDIASFDPETLRRNIAVVSQHTYLFGQTIRENLLLAKPGASDDELREALSEAGLESIAPRLDQWAGQHGMNLSGGERQRLAIARMLLQDAPFVILDEATANLDTVTEQAVLDTIERSCGGKTMLAITHRLQRMERFDEILVLHEGRITERGSHDTLLGANGLYAGMWRLQHRPEL